MRPSGNPQPQSLSESSSLKWSLGHSRLLKAEVQLSRGYTKKPCNTSGRFTMSARHLEERLDQAREQATVKVSLSFDS